MSQIVRQIKSRGYELDANMTVPASTLLRYLEHMRWESANDPKTNISAMFSNGFRMVVRAQQLEISHPVGLEIDLDISLELGHVGRASMEMLHNVTRTHDGLLLARGIVTAVYLDPSGRPHPIPDSIRDLVVQKERSKLAPFLEDNPPPHAWNRRFSVMPSDLDLFQHVNHARYLDYFEDTRLLATAANAYGEQNKPAGKPLFRTAIDYKRQALMNDEIVVSTWLCTPSAMGFEMRKEKDDSILATCRIEVLQ